MPLARPRVTDGLLISLGQLEDLVRPLTPAEWATPSRCAGWTAGDVARHAIGSMADVTEGRLDGLGTPEVTEREVRERAGRSSVELADECAKVRSAAAAMLPAFDDAAWRSPAPGGYGGTLGDGVEALWYDTWLHADDIRAALGRPSQIEPGLDGAVSHVCFTLGQRGWHGDVPIDEARAFAFVLAATGRGGDGSFDVPNIYA